MSPTRSSSRTRSRGACLLAFVVGLVGCEDGRLSILSPKDNLGIIEIQTFEMAGIPEVMTGPPTLQVVEPAIIADPNDPDHVAVAAMVEHRTRPDSAGKWTVHRPHAWTRVWQSVNGGKAWTAGQDLLPGVTGLMADEGRSGKEFDDGDGTLTVLPDGRIAVGIIVGDWFGPDSGFAKRVDDGPYDGLFIAAEVEPGEPFVPLARMDMSDIPNAWSYPHIPVLLADRSRTSPFLGRMYVIYLGTSGVARGRNFSSALYIKWSTDGGKTFTPPREIEKSRGMPMVDAVLSDDGGLHLVWQGEKGKGFYAMSTDGGESFTPAAPLAMADTAAAGEFPQVAIGQRGRNRGLIVTGIERSVSGDSLPRKDVYVSTALPGRPLGPFRRLDSTLPKNRQVHFGIPAVTDNALWILVYQQDSAHTDVVLYRSVDQGGSWHPSRVLAARDTAGFYPGHYIGLTSAKNRLYAAYSLPPAGSLSSPPRLFVTAIDVR